jgi:peptidoglycan hydrolase-like protein with peptidoglycan-binding domain
MPSSTGEHFNGKDVVIKDGFRVYNSPAESFEDHGRFFIVNKRYAEAMRHTDDAERFAQEIHKAGYATDPHYSEKLIGVIRKYKLVAYDKVARSQGALPKVSTSQGTTTSNPKASGPNPMAVKELQLLLVKYGYMTAQEQQTGPGVFGPKTRAALHRFQEDHGGLTASPLPTGAAWRRGAAGRRPTAGPRAARPRCPPTSPPRHPSPTRAS